MNNSLINFSIIEWSSASMSWAAGVGTEGWRMRNEKDNVPRHYKSNIKVLQENPGRERENKLDLRNMCQSTIWLEIYTIRDTFTKKKKTTWNMSHHTGKLNINATIFLLLKNYFCLLTIIKVLNCILSE